MFQLIIDNTIISPSDYDSLDTADITLRRTDGETGRITRNVAGNIKLYGDAYNIVKSQILDNPQGRSNKIPIEIFDTECQIEIYRGWITFEGAQWCFMDCEVTVNLTERGVEAEAITCIQSYFIFDNTFGFQQIPHNFIRHCSEMRPVGLFHAFLAIGLFIHINMYLLYPLILLISAIIVAINSVSNFLGLGDVIDDEGNDGILDLWQDLIQHWSKYITGCGNGHPAPYVRDYILNGCRKCGLNLQSTIFNQEFIQGNESWDTVGLNVGDRNPYWDLVQLDASVKNGQESYTTWIDDNKPNLMIESYLEFIKTVFNADYRVVGNTLTFERKDAFLNPVMYFDASNPLQNKEVIKKLCWRFNPQTQPAWQRFQFSLDGVDWVGNEGKDRFNDLIPTNTYLNQFPAVVSPQYSLFKGEQTITIQAAPQRYRRDGITEDVLTEWQGFYSSIGLQDVMIDDGHDFNIILHTEISFLPKLICLEHGTFNENAKVSRIYQSASDSYYCNKDMTFGADGNIHDGNTFTKQFIPGNLYDRFWFINDPRLNVKQGKKYILEISRCCELINELEFSKYVLLPSGYRGTIEEVTIKSDMLVITGSF